MSRTVLKARVGSVFRAQFIYLAPDGTTPISLVGSHANASVSGQQLLLSSAGSPGGIELTYDKPNGVINARIGADFTKTLSDGSFVFGLELVSDTDPTEVTQLVGCEFCVGWEAVE